MKRQIISTSSHPAELSVTLSFCDRDSRIWGSLRLNDGDMALVASAIHTARASFTPWISKEFTCVDDRTWTCQACSEVIKWIEGEYGKSVIDMMADHRRLSHGKTV